MKRSKAARYLLTLTGASLIALSVASAAAAQPRENVERVTDAYKAWVTDEGYTLVGRVRILLRPDEIVVQLKHVDGTTRLIFSADGTELLAEFTDLLDEKDSKSCNWLKRCDDSSGTVLASADATSTSSTTSTTSTTSSTQSTKRVATAAVVTTSSSSALVKRKTTSSSSSSSSSNNGKAKGKDKKSSTSTDTTTTTTARSNSKK